jgi:hypothetical protein
MACFVPLGVCISSICCIELLICRALEILFLRYLVLIVLYISSLIIDSVLGDEWIISYHSPLSLIDLLDSLSLLLLLFLFNFKHAREIK